MNRLDLLRETAIFSGCGEQDVISLGGIAQILDYEDKDVVFSQGDRAQHLMIVSSGSVQLELPLTILGETRNVAFESKACGEVVGWSALVPPYIFSLSAQASGQASVLALPREDLTFLLDGDPELGYRVMKNLAAIVGQRFHRTQRMWTREIQLSLDERYR